MEEKDIISKKCVAQKGKNNNFLMQLIGSFPPHSYWVVPLIIIAIFILLFGLGYFLVNAKDIGANMGSSLGNAAGAAKGYAEYIEKKDEWEKEGRGKGLSGEDTETAIKGRMTSVGKLDVLVAGISLNNFHSVGDDYTALYIMEANAVFYVDLSKMTVDSTADNSKIYITVPKPEVEVYYDESETKKLAEWQKRSYSGVADDGFAAYINSMNRIDLETSEKLNEDADLMEKAKASAEKQIKLLVSSICGADKSVSIVFAE